MIGWMIGRLIQRINKPSIDRSVGTQRERRREPIARCAGRDMTKTVCERRRGEH